jgi:hypothetical protein
MPNAPIMAPRIPMIMYAVSVASVLLLAEATLTDEPEEKKETSVPQESFA